MMRYEDRLVLFLDRISEWFDDRAAKWTVEMGKPLPHDLIKRRWDRLERRRRVMARNNIDDGKLW